MSLGTLVDQAEIRALVEQIFPFMPRPGLSELSFHGDDCAHCEVSRKFLSEYTGSELPTSAVRYLFDELSTLSPKGFEWVLPSYLRHVLDEPDGLNSSTEYLIYNLGPNPECEEETALRLSRLNDKQIQCFIKLIEHWRQSPFWGEYCPEELAHAAQFLLRRIKSA